MWGDEGSSWFGMLEATKIDLPPGFNHDRAAQHGWAAPCLHTVPCWARCVSLIAAYKSQSLTEQLVLSFNNACSRLRLFSPVSRTCQFSIRCNDGREMDVVREKVEDIKY